MRSGLPVAMTLLLAACVLFALLTGAYPLSPLRIVQIIAGQETDATAITVFFDVRLPRVVAAVLVGGALAASGAAFQGIFRNPLVSPDLLGVSAGAGLGAVIGIFFSLPIPLIQTFAFLGGMATVALVYAIATRVRGREPTLVLVLSGVVVGSLAGAAISLLKVLADPYDQLPAMTFWLLGSLSSVRGGDLWSAAPGMIAGLVPLALLRWRINVLSLGDEEARSLGVEAGRTRALIIAASTLMTASAVAVSGVIGWVGLVMPHIARMLAGPSFDRLLPTAIMLGAAYLVLVDTMARTISAIETPLGILTAIVGAPFFLWLLARGRDGWA